MPEPIHVLSVSESSRRSHAPGNRQARLRQRAIQGTAFDDPGTPLFDAVRSSMGLPLVESMWPSLQVPRRRRVRSAWVIVESIGRSATPGRHVVVLVEGEPLVMSSLTRDLLERTLAGLRRCTSDQYPRDTPSSE